jgi:hypothetical protein
VGGGNGSKHYSCAYGNIDPYADDWKIKDCERAFDTICKKIRRDFEMKILEMKLISLPKVFFHKMVNYYIYITVQKGCFFCQ